MQFIDAAIVGQLKLVKMLVERGADPNFKNRKGKTPCDVAASAVYNFLITARGKRSHTLPSIKNRANGSNVSHANAPFINALCNGHCLLVAHYIALY